MQDRKRRRDFIELNEYEDQESFFTLEPVAVEVGVGYSVAVDYDEEGKEIVQVKTYGKIDRRQVLQELKRRYPKAVIQGLEEASTIKVSKSSSKKRRKRKPSLNP
jgi:hypothetical protein